MGMGGQLAERDGARVQGVGVDAVGEEDGVMGAAWDIPHRQVVQEPHLALLLAGVVGRQQALDMQAATVLLIAPQPLVGLSCPCTLALAGTPAGRGPLGHRMGLRLFG